MSTTSAAPSTSAVSTRGWFRRNWKWFVPSMFAAAVLLGAIAVFGYVQVRSYRYRANPIYQTALAEVQQNPKIRERLGTPVVDSDWNPQGEIDIGDGTVGDAKFNFTISGPKGKADVGTDGRMVNGEWALTRLEVLFLNGDRMSLTDQAMAKQKSDTPTFDLDTDKQRKTKADSVPKAATNVNVDIPDEPPNAK